MAQPCLLSEAAQSGRDLLPAAAPPGLSLHLPCVYGQAPAVPSPARSVCPHGSPSLSSPTHPYPACATSSCGPAGPPDSELPAHTCTVYRPWFSPYSYFMCTKGAAQKQLGSLSSILASSTQEHEEPDDLSEIICSSSGSSDELQPTERDRPARNRASITFRDILAASQWQPVPQRGYQCVSCCRVFPTLWSVKDHIQHSSQEGYSCKVYYRKLKALWEKERACAVRWLKGKTETPLLPAMFGVPRSHGQPVAGTTSKGPTGKDA
uniref:Spermatogenesis associated 46 n=1 Tax=Buteo japonicus TaxID=224669 RepID=A0A8C0BUU7_9AVES